MAKHRDLIIILSIVLIGMFIPFLGSLILSFNLDITSMKDIRIIGSTFGWFLLIFGIELGSVYLYFMITNKLAQKKIDKEALLHEK
jgi:hypothetical protein